MGGRFVVDREIQRDALGLLLAARDEKTQKPIALRIIPAELARGDAARTLKNACREAAGVNHRNLIATYGVGAAPDGGTFVATEWVDGVPLSQVLQKRREDGSHTTLRDAYDVIVHISDALDAIPASSCHGALRPSVVWATTGGVMKIGDLGVSRAMVAIGGPGVLGEQEQASLAPEVKAGGQPTRLSDIFGLGAILYQLLTGLSPADGFTPPSVAHADATDAWDAVVLRCLATDPSARYQTPAELRAALEQLAGHEDGGVDIDMDMDVDMASLIPAAIEFESIPAPAFPPPPPVPRNVAGVAPNVGSRVSIHDEFRASLPGGPGPAAAEVDLGALLAKVTENDAPRWMVAIDGLDHGPFSGREIVERIVADEFQHSHVILNMDTGERQTVGLWPEFSEFLEQQKVTREHRAHKAAIARTEVSEKRSGLFKIIVATSIVAVLGGLGTVFALTRQAHREHNVAEADLANLYETGEIAIEGTAGLLPDPPRHRGGRSGQRRSGGGGGGGGSYEDAMNRAVDLGDVTMGASETRLTPAQVSGVMNRHVNSIYSRCVLPEVRSGAHLGEVQVDIAIAGNGSVLGASVRPGSNGFQGCVSRAVQSVRFPTFGAPRMGARYRFSVD